MIATLLALKQKERKRKKEEIGKEKKCKHGYKRPKYFADVYCPYC